MVRNYREIEIDRVCVSPMTKPQSRSHKQKNRSSKLLPEDINQKGEDCRVIVSAVLIYYPRTLLPLEYLLHLGFILSSINTDNKYTYSKKKLCPPTQSQLLILICHQHRHRQYRCTRSTLDMPCQS